MVVAVLSVHETGGKFLQQSFHELAFCRHQSSQCGQY
jgi:hypothetical protein